MSPPQRPYRFLLPFVMLVVACATGCGTIREQRATNQMLLSDAVDRAIAEMDFGALAYEKVFLDTQFVKFKEDGTITVNYVVSSLRQQMVVSGCLLQEKREDADYVVEARVGVLGADGHDVNYGVPASNGLNAAASLLAGSPPLPILPEVSLARRTEDMAAVKLAAFAYARETRMPVWQSGTQLAKSEATGTWLLGAGPFKRGSIYEGTEFAGGPRVSKPGKRKKKRDRLAVSDEVYHDQKTWDPKLRKKVESGAHLLHPDVDGLPELDLNGVQLATEPGDDRAADGSEMVR